MELIMAGKNYGWMALFVISLSCFIIALDSTFMNVAMLYLVKDLHTTLGSVQAIIAIYSLVMGSFFLLGAKLQDVIGRKRTFLSGALIYGIGALIAAASLNSSMLLLGWSVIEGLGAALMLPATASIVTSTYSGSKRTFAIGFVATISTISVAVGPLLGGFLTTFYSWRWGFALEAVIVLIMLLLSYALVESKPTLKWSDINIKGAVLSAAGILIVILGVLQLNNPAAWVNYSGTLINQAGFTLVMAVILAGILLLLIFFFYQRKLIKQGKTPFMNVDILKNSTFTLGVICTLLVALIQAGIFYLIPLYVQIRYGANAFSTGLLLLSAALGALIFSLSVSKLVKYVKPLYLVFIGFMVSIAGTLMLYLLFLNSVDLKMYDLLPGLFVLGAGLGIAGPNLRNIILSSLKEIQYADGSGIISTFGSVGSAIGTVLIGLTYFIAVYFAMMSSLPVEYPQYQSEQNLDQDIYSWVDKVLHPDISSLKDDPILNIITIDSSAKGMQMALLFSAILLFVGFLLSIFIKPPPQLS
jgi:MFS family permease